MVLSFQESDSDKNQELNPVSSVHWSLQFVMVHSSLSKQTPQQPLKPITQQPCHFKASQTSTEKGDLLSTQFFQRCFPRHFSTLSLTAYHTVLPSLISPLQACSNSVHGRLSLRIMLFTHKSKDSASLASLSAEQFRR